MRLYQGWTDIDSKKWRRDGESRQEGLISSFTFVPLGADQRAGVSSRLALQPVLQIFRAIQTV
jgi:hypothetical protein